MKNQHPSRWILPALCLGLATPGAFADDLEFHGYIRSGMAVNQDLQNAAKDNSHGGISSNFIGRLGNEADTWVESELVKKITADDGAWAKMHIGTSWASVNMADPLNAPQVGQAYVELGGFDFDPEAVFFVGKKANREDIHIMDLKWRKLDGAGFGVAGALGGNLEVNLLTGNNTEATTLGGVPLTLDVRYKLLPSLQLEVGAAWAKDAVKVTSDATTADKGFQGALVYYWDRFYGLPGWMTLALQGGTGMFGSAASGGANWSSLGQLGNIWIKQDAYAVRGVTSGQGTFGDFDVAAGLWGEYGNQAIAGSDPYTVVAGAVRPAWKLTKNLSLVGEAGASTQAGGGIVAKVGTGVAKGLSYHFALAPTLALDSAVNARPQLRVFVAYAGQDKALGYVSADGKKDTELKMGVQAEVWW